MNFRERLEAGWARSHGMLCVGLDPDPLKTPAPFRRAADMGAFCRAIVDATADLACAFKPQVAYFSAIGAEDQLVEVCQYIRSVAPHAMLILDAKRGDIGPTAERYAAEAFERYGAHAVTVNPYLGVDSIEPFLDYKNKGVFVLCRTSNPGGDDLQGLDTSAKPLYQRVAEMVRDRCNADDQCGLVVGATYPQELGELRTMCPTMPFLVPGVGAQGGDPAQLMAVGRTAHGSGMVVNSSRAILYASDGADFQEAARKVAKHTLADVAL